MKTLLSSLALFALLAVSCYFGYETGNVAFGIINIALIYGGGAVLVRKLKLV